MKVFKQFSGNDDIKAIHSKNIDYVFGLTNNIHTDSLLNIYANVLRRTHPRFDDWPKASINITGADFNNPFAFNFFNA